MTKKSSFMTSEHFVWLGLGPSNFEGMGCWSSPVDDTECEGHGQGHHDLKHYKAYNLAVLEA